MQGPKNQDESAKGGIAGDVFEPVVEEIEKNHLGLSGFENEISELFNFETRLEGQLQLTAFDDNVGEIEQMHL